MGEVKGVYAWLHWRASDQRNMESLGLKKRCES